VRAGVRFSEGGCGGGRCGGGVWVGGCVGGGGAVIICLLENGFLSASVRGLCM